MRLFLQKTKVLLETGEGDGERKTLATEKNWQLWKERLFVVVDGEAVVFN